MQEDTTLKKKNLQHPQRPTAPDDSLHRQKPTTPPYQGKMNKLPSSSYRNHHRVADLTGCYRTTCSPCSLSCTLTCWSRSRYLFSPQRNACSPARLLRVDKPRRQLASSPTRTGSTFPESFSSFTTSFRLLLPSLLQRTALLPGLSSPRPAAAGSSVLPSFTKLASGLLSS